MGTEGGRVRCSVVDKPMGYEGTEWARKGGHMTLLSEKSKDVMEPCRPLSFLVQGAEGRGRSVGGRGGSWVHKVQMSINKQNCPLPGFPLHDDRECDRGYGGGRA